MGIMNRQSAYTALDRFTPWKDRGSINLPRPSLVDPGMLMSVEYPPTPYEQLAFKILCNNCGSLSVKVADPEHASTPLRLNAPAAVPSSVLWQICPTSPSEELESSNSNLGITSMMLDQLDTVVPSNPLIDTASTILVAANDLGDWATLLLN
jgi:hypothetical protein